MKIIIYSKENCSQCETTKMFLNMKSISFDVKNLDIDFTQEEIVKLYPTARSYPIIVIDNIYIGGYKELRAYSL